MATATAPFSQLLDDAVALSRRRPFSVPLLVAAPLAVVNALWTGLSSWITMGAAETADPSLLLSALGAFVLSMPVYLVLQLFAYSVLAIAATRRALGHDAGLGAALRDLIRPRVFLTILLAAILVFFSILALVFPFFVVSALFSFLFPVMIDERRFGFDALARSSSLAWRNPRGLLQTWPLLLIMAVHAVYFAISTGFSLAVQAPVQVIQQAVMFRQSLGTGVADPSAVAAVVWLQVPLGLVTTFTSLFAAWYLFHCLALYFLDTRERREATSIERAIASWSTRAGTAPAEPALGENGRPSPPPPPAPSPDPVG